MTPNRFEHLVTPVAPLIENRITRFHEPVSSLPQENPSNHLVSVTVSGKLQFAKLYLRHRLQYTML